MAFSAGTYSLPGPALNTGDTVSATENNTLRNDMATAFNKTWLRDGTAAATANIPLGGFKLTGLAAGSTNGDSVRYEQLPSSTNLVPVASGGTGATTAAAALVNLGALPSTATTGFKNRIINGAMMIDQRNAGASVTNVAGLLFPVDRFNIYGDVASKFTAQQSSVAPAGFKNSLLITSLSSYSVGASEVFSLSQFIEGFNVADLAWGTLDASSVTLSFWVRSSLTGTFGGALQNEANTRSYPFSFTVNSANTLEYKTVTISGDTTGTWVTNNGTGIKVRFNLGAGSSKSGTAGTWSGSDYRSATGAVSVVGTNGATFYITGVQLEKGSTATSFDYRPYGTELALCQRYFEKSWDTGTAVPTSTAAGAFKYISGQPRTTVPFAVEKRAGGGTYTIYSPNNSASANGYNYNTAANVSMSVTDAGTRNMIVYNAGTNIVGQDIGFHWSASLEL